MQIDIEDYPIERLAPPFDAYRVDRNGNVWSSKRGDWQRLKVHRVWGGGYYGHRRCEYERVTLYANGAKSNFLVHRLVCRVFHGPAPTDAHVVRHLDGNASNNRSSNLRWGTVAQNIADRIEHGWTHEEREAAE